MAVMALDGSSTCACPVGSRFLLALRRLVCYEEELSRQTRLQVLTSDMTIQKSPVKEGEA